MVFRGTAVPATAPDYASREGCVSGLAAVVAVAPSIQGRDPMLARSSREFGVVVVPFGFRDDLVLSARGARG